MPKPFFNADTELASIRAAIKLRQRRRWHRSSLDPFTNEITALRQRGASLQEIRVFLKTHHLTVDRSTILRWLKKHNVTQG